MAFAAWTILCADSVIDKETGKLSFFNVLNQFEVIGDSKDSEVPESIVNIPWFHKTVTQWNRTDPNVPEVVLCKIALLLPNGEHIDMLREGLVQDGVAYTYKVDLSEFEGATIHINTDSIPYFGPGTYYYLVEFYDGSVWQECSRSPLKCTFIVNDNNS